MRQQRLKKLRSIFENECQYPEHAPYQLKKKIDKYKCMPDEYYNWDDEKYIGNAQLGDTQELHRKELEPGVASTFWE